MTPDLVREAWDRFNATVRNKVAGEYGPFTNQHWADICAIWQAHAAALEEIERLKAPASEGEIAETLKELREVGFYCEATVQDVIEIIESLAAKVAELEDDKRCLTVANEAMTNQANNAITRAERAEAALAEAERKGAAKQAEIDRLMLEFCPGEMTPEQLAEWGRHQRAEFKEG